MGIASLFDGRYLLHSTGVITNHNGRVLLGKLTKLGYRELTLSIDGAHIYRLLHRLVALSFIPNPCSYTEVNHIDGNKDNNHVDNLEWCTSSQNKLHARDSGLSSTKITMDIANMIRLDYQTTNTSHRKLAKKYGIGKTQVFNILNNLKWKVEA